eukprot:1161325-Pelagomonas_calceolata.AAC.18
MSGLGPCLFPVDAYKPCIEPDISCQPTLAGTGHDVSASVDAQKSGGHTLKCGLSRSSGSFAYGPKGNVRKVIADGKQPGSGPH